jgi:hypothetical protein
MSVRRIRRLCGAMILTLLVLTPSGATAGEEQVGEATAADFAADSVPVLPDGFLEAGALLQERLDAAPAINGGMRYDPPRKTWVVALVADSDATQKQALMSEIRRLLSGYSFDVVFEEAATPFVDQMDLMRQIAASPDIWGRQLGATVNGAYVNHFTHEVVIWVASKPSAATERAASAITGPVRLEVSGGIVLD